MRKLLAIFGGVFCIIALTLVQTTLASAQPAPAVAHAWQYNAVTHSWSNGIVSVPAPTTVQPHGVPASKANGIAVHEWVLNKHLHWNEVNILWTWNKQKRTFTPSKHPWAHFVYSRRHGKGLLTLQMPRYVRVANGTGSLIYAPRRIEMSVSDVITLNWSGRTPILTQGVGEFNNRQIHDPLEAAYVLLFNPRNAAPPVMSPS